MSCSIAINRQVSLPYEDRIASKVKIKDPNLVEHSS